MKAALFNGPHQDYEIASVPDPGPVGPNEILVKVGAAGVCRTDLHMWEGGYEESHALRGVQRPFIGGHETAGWIEAVGSGVTHLKLGDAVLLHPLSTCGVCLPCRAGDDMHCQDQAFPGVFTAGGFAEYVRTSARAAVLLPHDLSPADVAPLGCAGITAYHAVKLALPLATPGTSTVVLGAGGLGHIAIQALRALSQTQIIVVDRNAQALSRAREWGADHVVHVRGDGGHVGDVIALTGGDGAQVVIDLIGEGGIENDALSMVGTRGTDIMVGFGGKLVVNNILEEVLFPEKNLAGVLCGSYVELVELVALVQRRAVRLATTIYPLEAINDALRAMEEGRTRGRALLVPTL